MLRAAWKSLLGRKLRLFMSTFAIVLGVAFVGGTLIFTDTLNKSFVAIFDNSVGDVVVRPVGAGDADGTATTLTVPGEVVDELAKVPGAARADGNVAQQPGRRRAGCPGHRRQRQRRPGRARHQGTAGRQRPRPAGQGRGGPRRRDRTAGEVPPG
jgi:putative ABC transport system permease protein